MMKQKVFDHVKFNAKSFGKILLACPTFHQNKVHAISIKSVVIVCDYIYYASY